VTLARQRIAIVGAGAIGGTIGGHLARAGEDVLLVDMNRDLIRAVQSEGLTTRVGEGQFVTHPEAVHLNDLSGELEIVLLAVKSPHTTAAVEAIRPFLTTESYVVSTQNGLNEPIIADLIGGERTIGAFLNFAAAVEEPGSTRLQAPGAFYIGELDGRATDRAAALAKRLSAFLPVQVTSNVMGYLWSKLGLVALLNTTSTTDEPMLEVLNQHRELAADLVADVCEVAAAEGVRLERFEMGSSIFDPSVFYPREPRNWQGINACIDTTIGWQSTRGKSPRSGVWNDIMVKHIPSEIDGHSGPVIKFGEKHGLDVGRHRLLVELVHEIERGERSMSSKNVALLEDRREIRNLRGSENRGSQN
jgi:2-dehydropantoate 2-reductase